MIAFLCTVILAAQLTVVAPKPSPPADAAGKVEIILFSDFLCPFCAHFARAFRELQSKGVEGVQTNVQFKHFPLGMHPAAPLLHQAALAAGEQGKFWEMHDLLFANQSAVTRDRLVQHATGLGLDTNRFGKDLDSDRLKQLIVADKAEGDKLGVQGTPTFFVNGKVYVGTRSFEQLKQLVQNEQRRMRAVSEITDNLLSRGPADAPITLEFFADLQSPISRSALAVLDEAARRYPSKVRIQFRNFPLAFHPQAPLAHEAAMTAAAQGRFWEFARYILDHQDALREQDLIAQAGRLGLDEGKFAELLARHQYAPRVEVDLEVGLKRGIRGSPVIFVNGTRIDGVPNLEKLLEYVESELAARSKDEGRKP
jgi:protein-disulfide isomerase